MRLIAAGLNIAVRLIDEKQCRTAPAASTGLQRWQICRNAHGAQVP